MSKENRSIIIDTLRKANRPMSLVELSKYMCIPMSLINRILIELDNEGVIETLTGSENDDQYERKIRYFSLVKDVKLTHDTSIDDFVNKYVSLSKEMNQQYVNFAEDISHKTCDIENKVSALELQTKNIYANLISIMGIFVALFSLIIINTEAISKFIPPNGQLHDIFLKLVILNIPIVLSIIILMLCIRYIILKPLFKNEKKNSAKNKNEGN